ncbi:porin [Pseudomonadota bacterium AL_CKDN230030165-1A_HGKHYDSX7]
MYEGKGRATTLRARYAACAAWSVLAVSAAASATAAAQSSVALYGRLNTAMEYAWTGGDQAQSSSARMTNNRSVFGLRGAESLGDGLSAIFQIESGIAPNTGNGQIASRNTRVGLDSPYGTLFLGHWHTAYTESTMKLDPYYATTAGYMALIGNGSAASTSNIENTSSFDRRQKNSLHYRSPQWRGWSGGFSWGLPQERMTTPRDPQLFSWSASYQQDGLDLIMAYELHRNYQVANSHDDAIKFGLSYTFASTRLNLVYEQLRYQTATGDLARKGYYASVVQKLGSGSLTAAVGLAANGTGESRQTVGNVKSGAGTGAVQFTLGYEQPLSKRTSVYGYYSRINNRSQAAYDFAINELGVTPGGRAQTVALGLKHQF